MWIDITEKQKKEFNALATHPLQSFEWGEFREKTGIQVVRRGLFVTNKLVQAFQLTIHPIPHTSYTIGYLPKGVLPTKELLEELQRIGKEKKCIFIQLEPNIINDKSEKDNSSFILHHSSLVKSAHPLFTKYTLQLDLTKSKEELLAAMHPKTRYNIKVAQKHSVKIVEENAKESFDAYWHLLEETTKRQGFYAHTKKYHELMWQTLQGGSVKGKGESNKLEAHLFLAKYKSSPLTLNALPLSLTAWILFTFHDTLYYPYGASSREHREVMAQNLMMWEAITFGKKMGLKTFDMWGSLGENPDTKDPWYGFHRFKMGYNPKLVEFVGSYDLVINPILYEVYKLADKVRWILLKLKN